MKRRKNTRKLNEAIGKRNLDTIILIGLVFISALIYLTINSPGEKITGLAALNDTINESAEIDIANETLENITIEWIGPSSFILNDSISINLSEYFTTNADSLVYLVTQPEGVYVDLSIDSVTITAEDNLSETTITITFRAGAEGVMAEQDVILYVNQAEEEIEIPKETTEEAISETSEEPKMTAGIMAAPVASNVRINSTYGTNYSYENLTTYYNLSDADGDPVNVSIDWYKNGAFYPLGGSLFTYPAVNTLLNLPFDDEANNNGTTATDISIYGNDGAVTGATYYATGGYDGDGAYRFDGNDDYIISDTNFNIFANDHISWFAWIRPNSNSGTKGIMQLATTLNANQPCILIQDSGSSLKYFVDGGYREQSTTINIGTWYHIGVTYDGTTWRFYRDGAEFSNYVGGTNNCVGSEDIYLGNGYNGYFNGYIDEVIFLNQTLNATEISQIYNSTGNTNPTNVTVITSNLTSVGDIWQACVTPYNSEDIGNETCSNNLTILSISAVVQEARISPSPTAEHDMDLTGYCRATDNEEDLLTYYYRWYKEGVLDSEGYYNTTEPAGDEVNVADLSHALTSVGDNWTFSCSANDGTSNSSWLNSSVTNVTLKPNRILLNYPPADYGSIDFSRLIFDCSAEAGNGTVTNITLYSNLNETWKAISTQNFAATEATAIFGPYDLEGTNTLKDAGYMWNCLAFYSGGNKTWAEENYSFSNWDLGTHTSTKTENGSLTLSGGQPTGTEWTESTATTAPPERIEHAFVYDEANDVYVIYGGEGDWDSLSDTWIYDYTEDTWTEILPSPEYETMYRGTYGYDSILGQTVMMVYNDDSGDLEVVSFDAGTETWNTISTINDWEIPEISQGYYGVGSGYDYEERSFVHIVHNLSHVQIVLTDYSTDPATFSEILITDDPKPTGGQLIHDTENDLYFVWNGTTAWIFNKSSQTWSASTAETKPSKRYASGMTYNKDNKKILLHGGTDEMFEQIYDDTWEYDASTDTWTEILTDGPGLALSLVIHDQKNDKYAMFGGVKNMDTWQFSDGNYFLTSGVTGGEYSNQGTYRSRTFDVDRPVDWLSINWNENLPSGTDITFYTRISDDDVDWSSWDEVIRNSPSGDINRSSRYLQYMANMTTNNTNRTPALENLVLNYYAGLFVTLNYPTDDYNPVDLSDITFDCSAETSNGTIDNITLYSDIYGTWQAIETQNFAATEATAIFRPYDLEGTNTLKDGGFEWNCYAQSSAGEQKSAHDNHTFSNWDLGTYSDTKTENGSLILYSETPTGTEWTESTATTVPPSRVFPAFVYDEANDIYVIYGGQGDWDSLSDTWIYDYTEDTWTEILPSPEYEFDFVPEYGYDSVLGETVMIAYNDDSEELEVVSFDAQTETWNTLSTINEWEIPELGGGDYFAGLGYDYNERLFVRAEYNSSKAHILLIDYSTDPATFSEILTTEVPRPEAEEQRLIHDTENDLYFVWNGTTAWIFNKSSETWSASTAITKPSFRYVPGMTYNKENKKILLHGGVDLEWEQVYGDTWEYDALTDTWTEILTDGPGLLLQSILHDPNNDKYAMFGGDSDETINNETYFLTSGGTGGGYNNQGIYQSRIFDVDRSADWFNISWEEDLPPGTNITFYTRTSDEDVNWSSWDKVIRNSPSGDIIKTSRYLQYLANMTTNNTNRTPALNNLMIKYDGGLFVTLNYPTDDYNSLDLSDITFDCTAEVSSGTIDSITLYSDIYGTWQAIETQNFAAAEATAIFRPYDLEGTNTLKDAGYGWNCYAQTSEGEQGFAKDNYSFSNWDLGSYTGTKTENGSLTLSGGQPTGTEWTESTAATAPPERTFPVFVYDEANDVYVMYGGGNDEGPLSDTWTYDYTEDTWTEILPSPEYEFVMLPEYEYDSVLGETVMIVYNTTNWNQEVVSFDAGTETWNTLSTVNESEWQEIPIGFDYVGSGYDYNERLFVRIFHNLSHVQIVLINYSTDPATFSEILTTDGPKPEGGMGGGQLIHDTENNLYYVWNNTNAWIFNKSSQTWSASTAETKPSARYYPGMAYNKENKKILLHGGIDGMFEQIYDDTWEYDASTDTWTEILTDGPELAGSSILHDPNNDKYTMFGGVINIGTMQASDETYFLTSGSMGGGYNYQGTYRSRTFDVYRPADWFNISWEEDLPPETNITFYTRTSDDEVNWSSWDEVIRNSPSGDINKRSRYLQYMANLITNNTNRTPAINNLMIKYYAGLFVRLNSSQNVVSDADLSNMTFNCAAEISSGTITNITLYSNLNGIWEAIATQNFAAEEATAIFGPYDLQGTDYFKDGGFEWNCYAQNSEGEQVFAEDNYSFSSWDRGTYDGIELVDDTLQLKWIRGGQILYTFNETITLNNYTLFGYNNTWAGATNNKGKITIPGDGKAYVDTTDSLNASAVFTYAQQLDGPYNISVEINVNMLYTEGLNAGIFPFLIQKQDGTFLSTFMYNFPPFGPILGIVFVNSTGSVITWDGVQWRNPAGGGPWNTDEIYRFEIERTTTDYIFKIFYENDTLMTETDPVPFTHFNVSEDRIMLGEVIDQTSAIFYIQNLTINEHVETFEQEVFFDRTYFGPYLDEEPERLFLIIENDDSAVDIPGDGKAHFNTMTPYTAAGIGATDVLGDEYLISTDIEISTMTGNWPTLFVGTGDDQVIFSTDSGYDDIIDHAKIAICIIDMTHIPLPEFSEYDGIFFAYYDNSHQVYAWNWNTETWFLPTGALDSDSMIVTDYMDKTFTYEIEKNATHYMLRLKDAGGLIEEASIEISAVWGSGLSDDYFTGDYTSDDFWIPGFGQIDSQAVFDIDNLYYEPRGPGITEGEYSNNGTYESQIFDAGALTNFTIINWTETVPAGTNLSFTVRTAATAGNWSNWTDIIRNSPSGDINQTGQYIQYSFSATSNGSSTPSVSQVITNHAGGAVGGFCGDGSCESGIGEACDVCIADCGECPGGCNPDDITCGEWLPEECTTTDIQTRDCINDCRREWTEEQNCTCIPLDEEDWTCTAWNPMLCTDTITIQSRTCDDGCEDWEENQTCGCVPDWECTDWDPELCDITGIQDRICTDSDGCGTDWGKPEENQNCTCETIEDEDEWLCDSWEPEECSLGQEQSRICFDNCGFPEQIQECECRESWVYSDWTPEMCDESGEFTRTGIDDNNCNRSMIIQNESCEFGCEPELICEDWPAECPQSGEARRVCEDQNGCLPDYREPQSCEPGECIPNVVCDEALGECPESGQYIISCTDNNGCGEGTTEPFDCAPGEMIEEVVEEEEDDSDDGDDEWDGEILCVGKNQTNIKANMFTSGFSPDIPLPEGYDIVIPTFGLTCEQSYYELTFAIPNNYDNLRMLECDGSSCRPVEIESTNTLSCGLFEEATTKERKNISAQFRTTDIEKITDEITEDNFIIEKEGYSLQFRNPIDMKASLETVDHYDDLESNALAIISTPIDVETSYHKGSIPTKLIIPYDSSMPGIYPEGIGIFAWIDINGTEQWTYIGGVASEGKVEVELKNINRYMYDGKARFAAVAIVCPECFTSTITKLYDSDSKHAVMMVHGLGSSSDTFNYMVNDMAVYGQPFDVWGYDYATEQIINRSSEEFADILEANHNEFDNLYFISHSLGAVITQKALRYAYEENEINPGSYQFLDKVRKVFLVGTPNDAVPVIQMLENTLKYLTQVEKFEAYSTDNPSVKELMKDNNIRRVPNIGYYVIAGTKPYIFNKRFVKVYEGQSNDGIVAVRSAQHVGDDYINNSCFDFWQINDTHTGILDKPKSRKTIERLLAEEISADIGFEGKIVGGNQYYNIPISNCNPERSYVIIGKKIGENSVDTGFCYCGDDKCTTSENYENCPEDCPYEEKPFSIPWVWTLTAIIAALSILIGIKIGKEALFMIKAKKSGIPGKLTLYLQDNFKELTEKQLIKEMKKSGWNEKLAKKEIKKYKELKKK